MQRSANDPLPEPWPAHNHQPNDWVVQRNELFQRLRQRAMAESTSLKEIYDEEAPRYPLGAEHLLYENVNSSMRRWRRSTQPPIPASLRDFSAAMAETSHARIRLGEVTAGGAVAIIMGMEGWAQCLRDGQVLLLDGTFEAVPVAPAAMQLLTLHTIHEGRYFHPVVVLMERRTQPLYEAVFRFLDRAAGGLHPEHVLTDYEPALQAAAGTVWRHPTGCYFHFAQAIERRARNLGLSVRRGSDGAQLVALYTALALLPPQLVAPALAELPAAAATAEVQLCAPLHEYFVAFWMNRIGPQTFSVAGRLHRTTNVAEAFHRRLNAALRRHPNIWELTDYLHRCLNLNTIRFRAHLVGNLPGARNFARHAMRHTILARLVLDYQHGQLTMQQCLLRLARVVVVQDDNEDGQADLVIGAEVEVGGNVDDEDQLEVPGRHHQLPQPLPPPLPLPALPRAPLPPAPPPSNPRALAPPPPPPPPPRSPTPAHLRALLPPPPPPTYPPPPPTYPPPPPTYPPLPPPPPPTYPPPPRTYPPLPPPPPPTYPPPPSPPPPPPPIPPQPPMPPPPPPPPPPPTQTPPPPHPGQIQSMPLCCICIAAYFEFAIVPCGHVICRACLEQVQALNLCCPQCRGHIESSMRIYY